MLNLSDVIRPNQTWMAIFCKSGKEELGPVTMVYDIHTKTVFHSCRPESMPVFSVLWTTHLAQL